MKPETKENILVLIFVTFTISLFSYLGFIAGEKYGTRKANRDKFTTIPEIEWEGGFKGVSLRIDEDKNQTIRIFCK